MTPGSLTRLASRVPAEAVLGMLAACSAGVLLLMGARLGFVVGDWELLVTRSGFGAESLLRPLDGSPMILPALAFSTIAEIFGVESAMPFRIVATTLFLLSVTVVFIYLRGCLGAAAAVAGAASLLVLGAAWETLLAPSQLGWLGSTACGLGALLALEQPRRRGDPLACVLLAAGAAFSLFGIAFIVAAIAAIVAAPGPRASRAYVVAVPSAIVTAWWVGWGPGVEGVAPSDLATLPLFVVDGLSASLSALLGLATPRDEMALGPLDWGRPLLAAAAVLAFWRLKRLGRVPPGVAVAAALALSFWVLAGLNQSPGREAAAGRYTYAGVVIVLILAAELLRGQSWGPRALMATFGVLVLTGASNLAFLNQGYTRALAAAEVQRAGLAALEVARGSVPPEFVLEPPPPQAGLQAGRYLALVDRPSGEAEDEIRAESEAARAAADGVLAKALGITFTPTGERRLTGCSELRRGADGAPGLARLPLGGATVENRGGAVADLGLRRFATAAAPVPVGELGAADAAVLTIPGDGSSQPWLLELRAGGPLVVCGPGTESP